MDGAACPYVTRSNPRAVGTGRRATDVQRAETVRVIEGDALLSPAR